MFTKNCMSYEHVRKSMEESHPSSSSNQQKPWEPIVKLYRPEALISENELYDDPKG